MPLNIRSEEVNRLAKKLAVRIGVNKTEAVRRALQNELNRAGESLSLWKRLKPLRAKIAAFPDTGLVADKAFFDELNGED